MSLLCSKYWGSKCESLLCSKCEFFFFENFFGSKYLSVAIFKSLHAFIWLVVSTHLKNISQIGPFPQVGMKIKKYLKPPPSKSLHAFCADSHLSKNSPEKNICSVSSLPSEQRSKHIMTVHYTGWLIAILIMAYYNPI